MPGVVRGVNRHARATGAGIERRAVKIVRRGDASRT
jgi:hypothetical protein